MQKRDDDPIHHSWMDDMAAQRDAMANEGGAVVTDRPGEKEAMQAAALEEAFQKIREERKARKNAERDRKLEAYKQKHGGQLPPEMTQNKLSKRDRKRAAKAATKSAVKAAAKAVVKAVSKKPDWWVTHTPPMNGILLCTRVILDGEGDKVEGTYVNYVFSESSRETLVKNYPLTQEGGIDIITIPWSHIATWHEPHWLKRPGSKVSPLMCAYDATEDYCKRILGVTLDSSDKDFFRDHPLIEGEGLPMHATLRVIQETIAPYNLCISRVQVDVGQQLVGDLKMWRDILGCNPMGLSDRCTDNYAFAEAMKEDILDVDALYGFEFSDYGLRPGVVCDTAATTAATGLTGGHAAYAPPRRAARKALLSFQIGFRKDVQWRQQPEWAELPKQQAPTKEDERGLVPALFDVVLRWKPVGSSPLPGVGGYSKAGTGTANLPTLSDTAQGICQICFGRGNLRLMGIACDRCWADLWKAYKCARPACGKSLSGSGYPNIARINFKEPRLVMGNCLYCKQGMEMLASEYPHVNRFLDVLSKLMTERATKSQPSTPPKGTTDAEGWSYP
jgi:hypothetical protein